MAENGGIELPCSHLNDLQENLNDFLKPLKVEYQLDVSNNNCIYVSYNNKAIYFVKVGAKNSMKASSGEESEE